MSWVSLILAGAMVTGGDAGMATQDQQALALGRSSSAAQAAPAQMGSTGRNIRFNFVNTDVSVILRAISEQTQDSIIYSPDAPTSISILVSAQSTGEAVQLVAAAANMVFRQVGRVYVVASANRMKQAIEPFGVRERVNLKSIAPGPAMEAVASAAPFVTLRLAGDTLVVIGAPEDVEEAVSILHGLIGSEESRSARVTQIVYFRYLNYLQVEQVLRRAFGDPESGGNQGDEAGRPASPLEKLFTFATVASQSALQTSGGAAGGGAGGAGQAAGGGAVGGAGGAAGGQDQSGIRPAAVMGGSVVLKGRPDYVNSARELIEALDRPEAQTGGLNFQIYHVRYSSAPILLQFLNDTFKFEVATIGPAVYTPEPTNVQASSESSSVGGGAGLSGGGGGGGAGGGAAPGQAGGGTSSTGPSLQQLTEATTLVLRGTPETIEAALQLLHELDVAPEQVSVSVEVIDVSPERLRELGVNWDWSPLTFIDAAQGSPVNAETGQLLDPVTGPLPFGLFSKTPFSVTGLLRGLVTSREAKLLANPSMTVTNNQMANFFIGETIRARVAQAGPLGSQTVVIEEFQVGILLAMRPRVNVNGDITLRVEPSVSNVVGLTADNIPQTSVRQAQTTVVIRDGETLAIGGLIREEMSKTVREVPILSQIPIIGQLFRSTSTSNRKSEIMIFITPRIVKRDKAN
ncbi:MAG: type II secretion system protein GspD [Fimbriimonadaceae bacterium]